MAPTATAATHGNIPAATVKTSRIQPDPEVVQYPKFETDPLTPAEVFTRAEQVSELLHQDEAVRDRGNVVPYRQVQLLKDAGLVTILGPKSAGGAGLTWKEAYQVTRIIARGDGSLGQLIGYHYLWSWTAALVGTDEQRQKYEEWITKNKYFVGGAVNPRDADLKVQEDENNPDQLIYNGKKTFSTGSKVSDVTILEGSLPDGNHVFSAVLSRQSGIQYGDEWVDTLGMRGTQSGGISVTNVTVPWSDALGYVNKQFQPLGAYNTLNLPQIQLVFTSFYLGIAEGALSRALEYTKANTRGWPYQPIPVARGTDEAYIQIGYGDLHAKLWATASLIENVIDEAAAILHTNPRQAVTEEQRAKFAVRVAAAKVNAVDVGLAVTSQIYELTGARAVAGKYGFDVAFRDLRTHSLHDPIAHKRAEVGRYALHGPGKDGWPTPTWYT
ncbi:related to Dibenzothiophene desulfurization enzyme C [Melanopsichium pennsylvanicum]|uniref:Related to Dibenzothiophene desulfurization enzyme C n=2 Tax=Melanopsichium pennsylvanicum TaxID=63383 RepID=A0AAJ4XSS5_9BASI|nr:related to Dibenzothiophene desulfurization enzyme C [Melanopsichium pennsylvanicum 4]SNX87296.1 related to Dibenzothiophene desulfurization enzyme C [Melanopsichium pennsylvanicum]